MSIVFSERIVATLTEDNCFKGSSLFQIIQNKRLVKVKDRARRSYNEVLNKELRLKMVFEGADD